MFAGNARAYPNLPCSTLSYNSDVLITIVKRLIEQAEDFAETKQAKNVFEKRKKNTTPSFQWPV